MVAGLPGVAGSGCRVAGVLPGVCRVAGCCRVPGLPGLLPGLLPGAAGCCRVLPGAAGCCQAETMWGHFQVLPG